MHPLGVQLYTVLDQLNTPEQMQRTITALKAMGYETAQLCGSTEQIADFAAVCSAVGLTPIGLLSDLNTCEQNAEAFFALCRTHGIRDIGVSAGLMECTEIPGYIRRVNAFARQAKQEGFTFSYHNHGHEFIKTDCGKTSMELFLEGFDPECVDFMPDTYWIQDGGADVRHVLEQMNGRVKILHLKDMKRTKTGHAFAEIGSGNLYFPGIIETAKAIGVQHFVVEQDSCDGDPLDSLRMSITYLKNNDLI